MPFLEIMQHYFRGEKLEALFFILPAGLMMMALGLAAIKAETGAYAYAVAVPALLFGVVLVGTGLGVGLRTNNQLAELESSYQQSPVEMMAVELPRMEKVNHNFRTTYYAFGGVAVLGLLLHYFAGANLGRGLGATLLLVAATGLLIDGFAERRAAPYTVALKSIQQESQ